MTENPQGAEAPWSKIFGDRVTTIEPDDKAGHSVFTKQQQPIVELPSSNSPSEIGKRMRFLEDGHYPYIHGKRQAKRMRFLSNYADHY